MSAFVIFEQIMLGTSLPSKATEGSAAYDLHYPFSQPLIPFYPGDVKLVTTGLRIELPRHTCGLVLPRSGLALRGITVLNAPGLIDTDYRGELKVILHRVGTTYTGIPAEPIHINPGDRIAQLKIVPNYTFLFLPQYGAVDKNTERGTAGFGSTGA